MAVKKLEDSNDDESDFVAGKHAEDMRPVELPTGRVYSVYKDEVDFIKASMRQYMDDNAFVNQADLSDLDRLLIFEQLVLRWSNWLSTGTNYWGDAVNSKELHDQVKNISAEVRNIKQSLTIDKLSRDKQRAADDVAEYIQQLGFRAKHFGYKRNQEFAQMMEIFMELRAKIGLYERCDDRERQEQKVNLTDIHKWLAEDCFPKLDELDRKFRQETPNGVSGIEASALGGGQKMWIQSV